MGRSAVTTDPELESAIFIHHILFKLPSPTPTEM